MLCIALAACGSTPRPPTQAAPTATPLPTPATLASLGDAPTATSLRRGAVAGELALRVGEEAPLGEGGARLRFVRVVEDSRCPANARCIWQGRVVAELSVTGDGQPATLALGTLGGFADAPATAEAAGHTLSIAGVEPYPDGVTDIREDQYVLTLTISQGTGEPGSPVP